MKNHRPVAVVCLDADNGKTILVLVATNPLEAYASKDQKHLCFIREGNVVPPEKDPQPISEREGQMILRTYFGLRALLSSLFESTIPIHGSAVAPNESSL